MIGRLRGTLAQKGHDQALIDVGGVGYVVWCGERTLADLPASGAPVTLWTELLVREDAMQLFGFALPAEREWFRLLQTVQGVGARAALAILGALGPDGVGRALAMGDVSAMRAAPGIGPKIAQRVVRELADKAPALMAAGGGEVVSAAAPGAGAEPVMVPPRASGAMAEALSALANLGYSGPESAAALAAAAGASPEAGTADLIRAALARLDRREAGHGR